jgi:hypothetical protein
VSKNRDGDERAAWALLILFSCVVLIVACLFGAWLASVARAEDSRPAMVAGAAVSGPLLQETSHREAGAENADGGGRGLSRWSGQ